MKKQPGWALPNLKDAQVRTTKEAVIEKSLFQMPEQMCIRDRDYRICSY